jgi:hypothetical protein
MLTGPSYAAEKALKRAGMRAADIDLYDLNEAFASVVLRFMEVMAVPHDRINVNGGAIAMGHPLGATGAMILGTLLDELERRGASTGLAALCVGAGMGTATIIERISGERRHDRHHHRRRRHRHAHVGPAGPRAERAQRRDLRRLLQRHRPGVRGCQRRGHPHHLRQAGLHRGR